VRGIAEDLGVERGTLRQWLALFGTGKKTAADGTLTTSPLQARSAGRSVLPVREGETPEQTIDRLQARVRELEAETTKLTTEREILRSAAKYFAGETRW
jgi:transposase